MSGATQVALVVGLLSVIGVFAIGRYRNAPGRPVGAVPGTAPISSPVQQTQAAQAPVPAPPGDPPPGKVWSPEHGHWHDLVLTPQPDGPVPPGKVWVPEHGHWHDIATGQASPAVSQDSTLD